MGDSLSCVGAVLEASDGLLLVFVSIWFLLSLGSIILFFALAYIKLTDYRALKTGRGPGCHRTRLCVDSLVVFTAFCIAADIVPMTLSNLLESHLFFPRSGVDYGSLCGAEYSFYFYDLSDLYLDASFSAYNYILVLLLYYYYFRLASIVQGSKFHLTTAHKVGFFALDGCLFVTAVILQYFLMAPDKPLRIVATTWYVFLGLYLTCAGYLCCLLRVQLKQVVANMLSVANRSVSSAEAPDVPARADHVYGLMKRFTVLTIFALFSTVTTIIIYACIWILSEYGYYSRVAMLIFYTLIIMDANVNVVCLILQFAYPKWDRFVYDKICKPITEWSMFGEVKNVLDVVQHASE